MTVGENLFLGRETTKLGFWMDYHKLNDCARKMLCEIGLDHIDPTMKMKRLSLAQVQLVEIAKVFSYDSNIVIMDEPTRGIDIGSKREIYEFISEYANLGNSVIMISSELPEVLGISDRILVFRGGRIVADFERKEATQDALMHMASEDAVKEA